MLDRLPEEILINVVSTLGESLEDILSVLPLVSRRWNHTFGSENTRFWAVLAKSRCMSMISRRQHPKRAFLKRYLQQKEAGRLEKDRIVIRLIHRLEKRDCVMHVKRQLSAHNSNLSLVHHRLRTRENRSLIHYACWYGRAKTVKLLVEEHHQASLLLELDDSNASPLLPAAWAGQVNVVRIVLNKLKEADVKMTREQRQSYLDMVGLPPLTSSCGGKGSKSALLWAQRKGYTDVVKLLERAGATRKETADS